MLTQVLFFDVAHDMMMHQTYVLANGLKHRSDLMNLPHDLTDDLAIARSAVRVTSGHVGDEL